MLNMIVSQGRVADRAEKMIEGANLIADSINKKYSINPVFFGERHPITVDDWTISLPQAHKTLNEAKVAIRNSIDSKNTTLLLSNTCSVSLASLPIVAKKYPEAFVLWIDAHGDFNTPDTTDSGYLGGMVLAAACGVWDSGHGSGLNPKQAIIIGARDIDSKEEKLLEQNNVCVVSPENFTSQHIMDLIGDAPVWIHVDWDVLEPGYLPADYSVENGITPTQIKDLLLTIPKEKILGIELAEFNASDDDEVNDKALTIILDIISPILEHKNDYS